MQEALKTQSATSKRLSVIVPLPVESGFTYLSDEDYAPGTFVSVPWGKTTVTGVVEGETQSDFPVSKLKSILEPLPVPPLQPLHLEFLKWVARYTMSPLGSVLKMTLSEPTIFKAVKKEVFYKINPATPFTAENKKTDFAQALRKNATKAETVLWKHLRAQKTHFKFRRQEPIGRYIVDFINFEKGLVIEIDGISHDSKIESDASRQAYLEKLGLRVLRFVDSDILKNLEGCITLITNTLMSPPLRGEIKWGGVRLSPAQQNVIDFLEQNTQAKSTDIISETKTSLSVIKTLLKKEIILMEEKETIADYPCSCLTPNINQPDLTASQKKALDIILAHSPPLSISPLQGGDVHNVLPLEGEDKGGGGGSSKLKPILLDGVTGAGKTEVYFEAVAECLKRGQQALILAPEITLTNAFTDRFEQRFGAAPALWHSDLSHGVRRKTWLGVAHGKTEVIIGARSALFLPYKNLGLIVVDEEHDNSYKQDEGVIYNARDMAIVRAHLANIPIILVSATPSLETLQNTWDGRYAHAELPARYGAAEMPEVRVIDLRQEKMERQRFIGATLEKALLDTLARGEQSLLFLNRRGYAPLTICKNCGHRLSCPHCTAWLVEHKKSGKTQCHHCGFHAPLPKECADCHEADTWRACGPGVERIAEEVSMLFPQARLMTLSSDLIESPKQITEALQKIKNNEVDIIVGTQILAKGHHFPDLTTVGIVDSDIAAAGELRSAEKAFQLLQQVAGRAGRAEKKGIVYAQSFAPETPVLEAFVKGDRDAFFEAELQEREAAFMPPFSRLAAIIVADKDEATLKKLCQELAAKAPQSERVTILGPAPAMLYRLRGLYRMRFLIRADKRANINKLIKDWLDCVKIPSRTKVQIDIDPLSFY